ncbi:MAG: TrmH family RNA methyltransferase [Pseudomonadota bacterium]
MSLNKLQQPAILLVEPQMGENIGAAARAMLNFGLIHMRIVNPRDGWPNQAAIAMASGAARVLDDAMVASDRDAAFGDLNYIYATTARARDFTKPVLTPEDAMKDAVDRIALGERVGVLFGPERAGLETKDIVRSNALITVPVNPNYASLNLAQCVLLVAYEWRRQTARGASRMEMAGAEVANQDEIEVFATKLHEALDQRSFFWPEDKADSMRATLRNMLSRIPFTRADIRTWHGILKTLQRDPKDTPPR